MVRNLRLIMLMKKSGRVGVWGVRFGGWWVCAVHQVQACECWAGVSHWVLLMREAGGSKARQERAAV